MPYGFEMKNVIDKVSAPPVAHSRRLNGYAEPVVVSAVVDQYQLIWDLRDVSRLIVITALFRPPVRVRSFSRYAAHTEGIVYDGCAFAF